VRKEERERSEEEGCALVFIDDHHIIQRHKQRVFNAVLILQRNLNAAHK
jgi:hypothetical protein